MRSAFAIIILIFEILGLIITLAEKKDKIRKGFGRASWHFKNRTWRKK